MTESVADVVLAALSGLKRLLETVRESDDLSLRTSLLPRLDDELARLKVWAGNSGAHRTGRASLEHRLRDASHIRQQVLRLLNDLKESLADAADIMTGKATPWEEAGDNEEPMDDLETETEMEQIALDITELVDCLLRLSVSIQNPAPHDRFMSSTFTDTSAYEDFDIQHVQAKFQDVDKGLAQRLGKAMSRRRQYFKYREAHHQKLSHGLDRHGDTNKTDAPSTLASSIPPNMKQEVPINLSGDDTQSDGRASVTSFATSVSRPKTLKVPPMPEDALKGPFMCPFCYLIISVQDTRAWKKHVFGDLRPYNCVAKDCTASDQEFSRRNEWMQHMLQSHLRVYRCSFGCPECFSSAAESRSHLVKAHSRAIPESKVDSIVELSSQPLAQDAHTKCPFCPQELKSLKQYRRHVGNHQQDLALFVLPKTEVGNDDSEESHSISGHESDDISLKEQDERYTNEDVVGRQLNSADVNIPTASEFSKRFQNINMDDVFRAVQERGGYDNKTDKHLWVDICVSFGIRDVHDEEVTMLRLAYEDYIVRVSRTRFKETGQHGDSQQQLKAEEEREESLSFSESSLSGVLLENFDQRPRDKDWSTERVRQSRLPQNFDTNPTTSRRLSVSPTRSFHSLSQEEVRKDQLEENLDPHQRGNTPSPPRSVASWYDDPASSEFSEEDDLPFGLGQSPENAVSSPQRHQRLNDHHKTLRRTSKLINTDAPVPQTFAAEPVAKNDNSQIASLQATSAATDSDGEQTRAKVLYNFTGEATNELTVQTGEEVEIIEKTKEGWSLVRKEHAKESGPAWVPTAYVKHALEQRSESANPKELSYETPTKPVKAVHRPVGIERLSDRPRAREPGEGNQKDRFLQERFVKIEAHPRHRSDNSFIKPVAAKYDELRDLYELEQRVQRKELERAEEAARRQRILEGIDAQNMKIHRRPAVPATLVDYQRLKTSKADVDLSSNTSQTYADRLLHEHQKRELGEEDKTLPTQPLTAAEVPGNQEPSSMACADVPSSSDQELVDAVRRLEINERLAAEDRAHEKREREDEDEAQRRRLMERMMPRRRATVGPGTRRHRVLYDNGTYRWE